MPLSAPSSPASECASTALRAVLVDDLSARGVLAERWREAFATIRREDFFAGAFALPSSSPWAEHPWYTPEHEGYLRAVYRNTALINRAARNGRPGRSMPSPAVTAAMLGALGELPPGAKALEIGTGSGYLTALLQATLSAPVTSLETDALLLGKARNALAHAGYAPQLVHSDSHLGHPPEAPYDALLFTAPVPRIPPACLHQTRPGAVIVARLGPAIAALTVDNDGSATGPLLPLVDHDWDQPWHQPEHFPPAGPPDPDAPALRVNLPDPGADMPRLLRHLFQPDVRMQRTSPGGYRLTHAASDSWATIAHNRLGSATLARGGPHDLLQELLPPLTHWASAGRPGPATHSLTIHPDGTHTLHHQQAHHWPLPDPDAHEKEK